MTITPTTRVVVLGGTSGIGLAVAGAAVRAGAQVVVGGRSAPSLQRALVQLGGTAGGHQVDVADASGLASFFAAVGAFDHLVYTAGDELVRTAIADYTADVGRRSFDVRLFHALDSVRAALPTLAGSGSITLTSGAAAYRGGPGRLLGAAVSGAVIAAGRSLAVELAPVRVNVVAPTLARTPLWSAMPADAQEQMFAAAGGRTLLGRVPSVQEIARTYLHLMDHDGTTGVVSLVDGGSVLA